MTTAPDPIERPIEWIGALVQMPMIVHDAGGPQRPEGLLWLRPDLGILGFEVAPAGELLPQAAAHLQGVIDAPQIGAPHTPDRVRVDSEALAEVLRRSHWDIEIVCAPTPEVPDIVQSFADFLDEYGPAPSYLDTGATPGQLRAFFGAAEEMYQQAPWRIVPDDTCVFELSIEALGVRSWVLSVIGQAGHRRGMLLFPSAEAFDVFYELALTGMARPEAIPPHLSLSYERAEEQQPSMREEIAQHGWPIAGPAAYPMPVAIDGHMQSRLPSADEIAIIEATCRALMTCLDSAEIVRRAWEEDIPVECSVGVKVHGKIVEVLLKAPLSDASLVGGAFDPDVDPFEALEQLRPPLTEDEEARADELNEALFRKFLAAPESAGLNLAHICTIVCTLGYRYCQALLPELSAADLEHVVFTLMPRKVMIEPEQAGDVIAELKAFYTYLHEVHDLEQAPMCIKVLSGKAVDLLRARLRDPSLFGPAKSMFAETGMSAALSGTEAFDFMEELGAVTDALRRVRAGAQGDPAPANRRKAKGAQKTKKKKRKAAQRSRKKNR
ncbi:MAG: hypothetical protein ACE366_04300 [Bradymonadia bacterium]